ncbi:MAG: aminotransferase class IV [Planctomycetota bacterium]|nr:aminotransferase class IV [Planctomycetota bacterium]
MTDRYVYLNGRIVPEPEASLSVFDTGFLHGASVFTTLRSHNGAAFRLDRHIGRLLEMAEQIGISHDATAEGLTAAVADVLKANDIAEGRIRITISPGPVGMDRPTVVVTASALEAYPQWWYTKGIGAIVSGVRQFTGDPTSGLKTGCYLPRVLARQAAATAGAEEAIWFTETGHLAEACFCNVFIVRNGEVSTPPLETPVLPGVVRQAVIELCEKLNIPCHIDKPITGEDVSAADEIFLSSSTAGIRPVVRIAKNPVGDEKPGPITKKLISAYENLLEQECPKDQIP